MMISGKPCQPLSSHLGMVSIHENGDLGMVFHHGESHINNGFSWLFPSVSSWYFHEMPPDYWVVNPHITQVSGC